MLISHRLLPWLQYFWEVCSHSSEVSATTIDTTHPGTAKNAVQKPRNKINILNTVRNWLIFQLTR